MKLNLTPLLLLLTIIVSATGCINLKEVSNYSTNSATALRKFEDIGYSFRQHCNERCIFEAVRHVEIRREADCDCGLYKTADSVTLLIYHALRRYFDGLGKLSENKLTRYSSTGLQQALTTGHFGNIEIHDTEVKAYSRISSVLLRATTDLYRKRKLKMYIEQANDPVQVLLDKFRNILQQELVAELNFKKERLYAFYQELGLVNILSGYEKQQAAKEYYQQLKETTRQQQMITSFVKGLQHIAAGHQHLFEQRHQLSAKALRSAMLQYTSDVQDIMAAFNQLKK